MTSKQRAALRAKANELRAIFQIGKQDIGDNLIAQSLPDFREAFADLTDYGDINSLSDDELDTVFRLAVQQSVQYMLLYRCGFGTGNHRERTLRVTIPETLDFEGVFDDLFAKYTASAELMDVRTTGMGSLYRLSYRIVMRDGVSQKQMIDDMRARNGNLEIVCSREVRTQTGEL